MGLVCRLLVRGERERECRLDPTGSELHARLLKILKQLNKKNAGFEVVWMTAEYGPKVVVNPLRL